MSIKIPIITDSTGQAIASAISQTDVAQARIAEINAAAQEIYHDLEENYPKYDQVLTNLQTKGTLYKLYFDGSDIYDSYASWEAAEDPMTFEQIRDLCYLAKDMVYIGDGQLKYYPQLDLNVPTISLEAIEFMSSSQLDGKNIHTRIIINADNQVKTDEIIDAPLASLPRLTLLWTNTSPDAVFNAQSVTYTGNFSLFLIEAKVWHSNDTYVNQWFFPNSSGYLNVVDSEFTGTSPKMCMKSRAVTISSGTISFDNAINTEIITGTYPTNSSENGAVIPVNIYGMRIETII